MHLKNETAVASGALDTNQRQEKLRWGKRCGWINCQLFASVCRTFERGGQQAVVLSTAFKCVQSQ